MVTSGVVWCYKDDHWIPLQLSSIRLHGVLTQAHWVAVSEFLQRMANKQLVLQDNCFKELTEQQKALLLEQQKKLECSRAIENEVEDIDKNLSQLVLNTLNNNVLNNDSVIKLADNNKSVGRSITTPNGRIIRISKSEIGDDKNLPVATDKQLNAENSQVLMFKFEKPSLEDERQQTTDNNKNLFINNLFPETDIHSLETNHDRSSTIEETNKSSNNCRKASSQSDEIALRLLRKYCKYSRDALDDDILCAIEATEQHSDEEKPALSPPTVVRTRKLGYCPRNEKLYENCSDMKFSLEESIENDRNEHVLRWLKQQNRHGYTNKRRCSLPTFSSNRKSSVSSLGEPSPTDSRKSSLTIKSDGKSSFSSGFESQKSSVISATESRDNSLTSSPSASERRSSVRKLKCRKSSVTSNSSTESEENGTIAAQWHKILKKHLESKKLEKRLKKQREAWARNTRKLSSGSESYSDISTKP
ncbi:hypothetical protein Trydic_g4561 [Trypoxylus dichotomus]